MERRPASLYEERVSQEDFPRHRVSETGGLHSKSFRPCPGRRVEKPRRLSSKASTEAAASVDGLLSPYGQDPQRPAFPRCQGESEVANNAPPRMPVRLVSLP